MSLLFDTQAGCRFLAWLETRYNLALVGPPWRFVDASLLSRLACYRPSPPRKELPQ